MNLIYQHHEGSTDETITIAPQCQTLGLGPEIMSIRSVYDSSHQHSGLTPPPASCHHHCHRHSLLKLVTEGRDCLNM